MSPPDLAGVEFSQYIPKENIYEIYAESAEQAECYFSQFCQQERIECMRVPEGPKKTPDFVFYPSGQKVAVEVKWRNDGKIKAINSVRLDLTAKSLYFKTHITAATVFINAVVCRLSS